MKIIHYTTHYFPVDGIPERLVHVDGDQVADADEEVDEEAVLLLRDLLEGGHQLGGEAEAPVRRRARHRRHMAVPVGSLTNRRRRYFSKSYHRRQVIKQG